MTISAAASLSTHGWIDDTAPMFTYLYSQFLLVRKSQTSTHGDRVASLADLVAKYQTDPVSMARQIEVVLTNYLSPYYQDVIVTCVSELQEPETSTVKTKYTLTINFTHKGVRHDASKFLTYDGTTFQEIAEINNG